MKYLTIFSLFWSFVEKLLNKGSNIVITIMLTWYVSPDDFFKLSVIMFTLALSTLFIESGFSQSIVRTKELSDEQKSIIFSINMIMSILLFLLTITLSPFIADLYDRPDLRWLIVAATIPCIINSALVVPKALYVREIKFKTQALRTFPATLASLIVAFTFLAFNFEFWSVIISQITYSMILLFFYYRKSNFRPKFHFDVTQIKGHIRFSTIIVLDGLLSIPYRYMYSLVLPLIVTGSVAGVYILADNLRQAVFGLVVQSFQTVTYPVLSKQNGSKTDVHNELTKAYKSIVELVSFIFPLLIGLLYLSAPILFDYIFPPQWGESVRIFQILLLIIIISPISSIAMNVLKVLSEPGTVLVLGVIRKIFGVTSLYLFISWGVYGVLFSQALLAFISLLLALLVIHKKLAYNLTEQIRDIFINAFPSVFALIIFTLGILQFDNIFIDYVFSILTFCLSFTIAVALLRPAGLFRCTELYFFNEQK